MTIPSPTTTHLMDCIVGSAWINNLGVCPRAEAPTSDGWMTVWARCSTTQARLLVAAQCDAEHVPCLLKQVVGRGKPRQGQYFLNEWVQLPTHHNNIGSMEAIILCTGAFPSKQNET